MRSRQVIPVFLMGVALINSGCGGMTRAAQRPPAPMAYVKPLPPETLDPKKGSIWQTSDRNTLFLDSKARNVGDLVTVQITEDASAKKDAKTDLKRKGDDTVDLGGLFGLTSALQSGGLSKFRDAAKIKSDHTFSGEGTTSRSGNLKATMSCVVTEVLPNGNLRVEGRRDITVNNENQFIILSGVIRPEDISGDNAILSNKIADARIEYSGDGDVNDQQQQSWIQKFMSSIRIF
ncbi:MAG: flagellar basal body L-ring protein FlgH [Magnetococcales bacterium]|nr:flagellar basal body L-ring protein FlgH [Magnetococcales bacterium]MBF0322522.1 flagellar basal body L-ring protein FlgH [Magnetococcales bacterium]